MTLPSKTIKAQWLRTSHSNNCTGRMKLPNLLSELPQKNADMINGSLVAQNQCYELLKTLSSPHHITSQHHHITATTHPNNSQQHTTTTMHHNNNNNTSPQQSITTTIYQHNITIHHANNTSPQQYITTTIHHNNNNTSQHQSTNISLKHFTTTTIIHHHNTGVNCKAMILQGSECRSQWICFVQVMPSIWIRNKPCVFSHYAKSWPAGDQSNNCAGCMRRPGVRVSSTKIAVMMLKSSVVALVRSP